MRAKHLLVVLLLGWTFAPAAWAQIERVEMRVEGMT